MKWFIALNEACSNYEHYGNMAKVAVLSAKARAPRLVPHLIFDGSPNEFTAWMEAHGVRVIRHQSAFIDELRVLSERLQNPDIFKIGTGAFLRVDLPEIMAALGWSDEYVLYTDCDVMFARDPVPVLESLKCRYFSVAPEFDRKNYDLINTGVMLMNIPALHAEREAFGRFIRSRLPELVAVSWDQEAYRLYYKKKTFWPWNRWGKLPLELNWKPYWGRNDGALIVHFHGPKPFMEEGMKNRAAPPILLNLVTDAFFEYCKEWNDYLREPSQ